MAARNQPDEYLAKSKCNRSDFLFDTVIGHIEDIILDCQFQTLQQTFMDKYCMQFDDAEENKLIYTDIHKEYVQSIENYLETELLQRMPTFKMVDFQKQLVARRKELNGEVFEILFTFTDFLAFKELVLDYKAEKEGRNFDFNQGFIIRGAESSLTSCRTDGANGALLVAEPVSENEPMRISLEFDMNDDYDEDVDICDNDGDVAATENCNIDPNEQINDVNDDMGLLVIGTSLRPPPSQNT